MHTVEIEVRSSDVDFMGGASNAKYLDFFSYGSFLMIKMLGFDVQEVHKKGYDCVIVETNVKYKKSLGIGDRILVCSNLEFKRSIQIIFNQQILRLSDNEIVAEGKYTGCIVEMANEEIVESTLLKESYDRYLAAHTR